MIFQAIQPGVDGLEGIARGGRTELSDTAAIAARVALAHPVREPELAAFTERSVRPRVNLSAHHGNLDAVAILAAFAAFAALPPCIAGEFGL
ncbi:hypothetical protein AB0L00_32865 [Actinoallomurus sp. NPDC052308]|uniref:hypothetical protein n=1 Tax=Actinoallomurus sp. NPDC052308 TaxID=3155530 RepID=UPI003428D9D4